MKIFCLEVYHTVNLTRVGTNIPMISKLVELLSNAFFILFETNLKLFSPQTLIIKIELLCRSNYRSLKEAPQSLSIQANFYH